jgi:hypothetical protein
MSESKQPAAAPALPTFPLNVPRVSLARLVLQHDVYCIHVLPLMLDEVRKGKNVPVIAVRRYSDDRRSLLLAREVAVPVGQSVLMQPQFDSPLPGSTTVVWNETSGKLFVWHEVGKVPNWIPLTDVNGKPLPRETILPTLIAEATR